MPLKLTGLHMTPVPWLGERGLKSHWGCAVLVAYFLTSCNPHETPFHHLPSLPLPTHTLKCPPWPLEIPTPSASFSSVPASYVSVTWIGCSKEHSGSSNETFKVRPWKTWQPLPRSLPSTPECSCCVVWMPQQPCREVQVAGHRGRAMDLTWPRDPSSWPRGPPAAFRRLSQVDWNSVKNFRT